MSVVVNVILSRPNVVAGVPQQAVVQVFDSDGDTSYKLTSAQVTESTESDAQIGQPSVLAPNAPLGTGNVTIPQGGTAYLPFSFVLNNPYFPGPSPQAPGGAAPTNNAAVADAFFTLTATVNFVTGAGVAGAASGQLLVPVLATIPPFPIAQGGALQLSSGFNLLNGLTLGLV